jgi:hypothetical protein
LQRATLSGPDSRAHFDLYRSPDLLFQIIKRPLLLALLQRIALFWGHAAKRIRQRGRVDVSVRARIHAYAEIGIGPRVPYRWVKCKGHAEAAMAWAVQEICRQRRQLKDRNRVEGH